MRDREQFIRDLAHVINCHSAENGSDTPDFIVAEYLAACLDAWDVGVTAREKWYGRGPQIIVCDVDAGVHVPGCNH